jgi:hypothetical protein
MLTSLVKEIESGTFNRSQELVDFAKNIMEGEQLFVFDLMGTYLSSKKSTQFTELYKFVRSLPTPSIECVALSAIWHKIQAARNTMEGLVVWIYASEITRSHHVSEAGCIEIANSPAPAVQRDAHLQLQILYKK